MKKRRIFGTPKTRGSARYCKYCSFLVVHGNKPIKKGEAQDRFALKI